jgi:hypothetical protein
MKDLVDEIKFQKERDEFYHSLEDSKTQSNRN